METLTHKNRAVAHYLDYVINYFNIESYAKANKLTLKAAKIRITTAKAIYKSLNQ